MKKNFNPTKLLWLDLEMTGLDAQKHVILEVAAEITDLDFNKLASYEAIIKQSDNHLDAMDDWPTKQHAKSGLTERVLQTGRPEREVEAELVALVEEHFGKEPATLAGNSIHMDRLFIRQHWPRLETKLHYRMLDVSSWKIIMSGKYGLRFSKKSSHRALDDINESIAELKFYLGSFKEID